jgi:glycosyltransferase involved in cell wall biosynthesis
VVGSIDSETSYVKELLQLHQDRIHFIGAVYDKVKLQALRYHSWVYFHGHTVGGTNPSLLEALGCGNIIIANDNVFNREVAGEVATFFEREQDLAERILAVESYSLERLNSMRAMAQERVKEAYSWNFITVSYFEMFNTCYTKEHVRVRLVKDAGHSSWIEKFMHT